MNRHRENTRKRRYRGGNGEATAATAGQPDRSALGKLWNAVTAPVSWLAGKFTRKANVANSAGMAAPAPAANYQQNPGNNNVQAAANAQRAALNPRGQGQILGENPGSNNARVSLNPPPGPTLAPNPSSGGGRCKMRKMSKKHRKSSKKHMKHRKN